MKRANANMNGRNNSHANGWRRTGLLGILILACAGCATPTPQFTDEEWVSHTTTGRGSRARGDERRAADAFARAQQRARALDDADALAVSAVNRAYCLLPLGRASEARADVAEALSDARVSTARRAELLAAAARVELALNQPDAALTFCTDAAALQPPCVLQAQLALSESAAWMTKKDNAAAAKALSALPPKIWAQLPESVQAEHALRRGEIAEADEKFADAAVLYDETAALWKSAGRLPEMARALQAAGRQYRAAGDIASACDRLYRAAQSFRAQGLAAEAIAALDAGVSCAEVLKDDATSRRMAELVVTFQQAERPNE